MKKINAYSITRSSTTKQNLPVINVNTPKTPRMGSLIKNKSYLGQLEKQFSLNPEYDAMDRPSITNQQMKLKKVLRKMNDATVRIISDYTPKPQKKLQHSNTTTTTLVFKQLQNNDKVISQCQYEIQKLIQRAEEINSTGKQVFYNQLSNIQAQIHISQQQIKNLRIENERRGKFIITQNTNFVEGEIRRLQQDVYMAENRACQLRADDLRIQQQINQYQQKLKQIYRKSRQVDKFFKQQQKKINQQKQMMSNQYQLIHKKVIYQNNKKKYQFYNQNYQYRYLNLLRNLDTTTNTIKEVQDKIDKSFVSLQASKMVIGKLQAKLKSLKIKNMQRKNQINQYLRKTKEPQSQIYEISEKQQYRQKQRQFLIAKDSRISNGIKQMPSQISIKQQVVADNSAMDLDKEIAGLIEQNSQKDNKNSNRQQKKQSRTNRRQGFISNLDNKSNCSDILLNDI